MKKSIILGITSGIAAYKSLELITALRQAGLNVFVIMTHQATRMISILDFEKASGHKVFIELFEKGFNYKNILKSRIVDHIQLADQASLMVIAPATANIIAKLACGLADDFLTTTALAMTCPIIICPSMNVHMWNNPLVQANITKLKLAGYQIVKPDKGMLACGYEGVGRLAEIGMIKNEVLNTLKHSQSLTGRKIIVTAGGTMEKIDDVRYITNRSSGKMGLAIAEECYRQGATVLLLQSKTAVKTNYPIQAFEFSSAKELLVLVKKHVKNYDLFYHVAAVSDFSVANQIIGKLSSKKKIIITLKPQVKILDLIKKLNPKIKLIAFKAEATSNKEKLIQTALAKLKAVNAEVIVANDVSKEEIGFESDKNEVYIVFPDGSSKFIPLNFKSEVAQSIVETVS